MATTSPNKPLQRHQKSNIVVENSTAPIESKRKQTSYAEGIANALTDINHPNGSSTAGIIKKYMQANLPANETWSNYIFKSSLQKMIAKGDIIKTEVIKTKKCAPQLRYTLRTQKAASQEDAAAATAARAETEKQNEAQAETKKAEAQKETEAAEDAKKKAKAQKEAEAEAKADAEQAEDERVLAEFEVFLQNSTLWLKDINDVEQMEEKEGRFVDDNVSDVALEELEKNFLHEMREVAAAMPVSKPVQGETKATAAAPKEKAAAKNGTKTKQLPMYNFRGCAPTEGAIAENKQEQTKIERAYEMILARKLLKMEYNNKNNTHPAKARMKRPPPERGKIRAGNRGCRPQWPQVHTTKIGIERVCWNLGFLYPLDTYAT